MAPGSMTTLSVPADVVASARSMSLLNGLGGSASERLSNLAGATGGSITAAVSGGLDVLGGASLSGGAEASAGAATEVTPGSAGPAAAGAQLEADTGKQISLETLARQVYDRIRARLIIERERSGLGSRMVSR
jgi:hypothetical protein